MKTINEINQSCEITQISISDAIDSNKNLNQVDAKHIESCTKCAQFYQLWAMDSPITKIASGSLLEQMNLSQPIISHIESGSESAAGRENRIVSSMLLSMASLAAVIAIVIVFTFYANHGEEKQNLTDTQTPKNNLNLKIPKFDVTLSEEQIKESLEEKYQTLSETATQKWKAATTSIARATEYIADGTHYISNKYIAPPNEHPTDPQSRLTPQQVEPSPLHYG